VAYIHFNNRRELTMATLSRIRCQLAITLFVGWALNAAGLQLLRGPYLQLATTNSIIVRWRTDEPVIGVVRFGSSSSQLTNVVTSAAAGTNHVVALTQLAPGTKYYYSVGNATTTLASGSNCYFRTLPMGPRPTRIWAIGDAGTAFNQPDYSNLGLIVEGQRQVRDAYYSFTGPRETDVWLLLGDNAYNDGNDGDYQTNFFQIYSELARNAVIWPAIGNHEVDLSTGDAPDYLEIFSLPTQAEAGGVPSGYERYYSFTCGNIHFVCLDSEISNNSPGSSMLQWLESDLAANTNDWLIAFWHSPPYSKGSHDSDSRSRLIRMRQNVVPILEAHGVDLVLCGHSHVYERSFLIDGHYGSSSSWTATMARDSGSGREHDSGPYLKTGTGAAPRQGAVYVVAGSSGWAWRSVGLNHPAMFIGKEVLGSLVIDVDGQRLDAKFLRETGAVDDWFSIIKGQLPAPLRFATFEVRNGTVRAQFKSQAGQRYRVLRTDNLVNPLWQPVSGEILASGATTSWSGPDQPGLDSSYYRVQLLP
jgi:acid phosphatase type 7